ncbi:MAG: cation-transporting P-type ATPase, partial [Desulfobacterales bacterium]
MSQRDRQTPDHFSRPIEQVLKIFDVKPDQGLSEAQVQRRRERHGPNRLREAKRRGAGRILIEQFKSMVIIVLVIAGAVAFSFQHWAE